MALIACKDCKKAFSTDAKRCPHCGAKKKSNTGKWLLLLFVIVPLVSGGIGAVQNGSTTTHITSDPFDTLRARAHVGEHVIQQSMRNPDSFKISTVIANTDSGAICYEYRAQNGFGGMNVGHAVLKGDESEIIDEHAAGFSKIWKKECLSNKSVAADSIALLGRKP